MLLIAKLNNFNSVEKMNNLHIAQRIYLPDKISKQNENTPVKVRVKTDAEKSIMRAYDILKSSKSIKVDEAGLKFTKCYHVYNKKLDKNGYSYTYDPIMSFNTDSKGKIVRMSLEDVKGDIDPYGYDYVVDEKGNINTRKYPYTLKGKLSQQEKDCIHNELYKLIKN